MEPQPNVSANPKKWQNAFSKVSKLFSEIEIQLSEIEIQFSETMNVFKTIEAKGEEEQEGV